MTSLRAVHEVARWELFRFVKLKEQVVGLLITLAILFGISVFTNLGREPSTIEIAVIGDANLPTLSSEAGPFQLQGHDAADEARLRTAVEAGDLAGLLVLGPGGKGELFTRQDPSWRAGLERELTTALTLQRLEESGIGVETWAALHAPFQLEVREAAPRAGRTERIAALVALGFMMVGLFIGMGYVFSSITGEKQNRLSEQVISAIPAQAWIDGKIVGLATVSMTIVANTIVAIVLWLVARWAVWGDAIPMPGAMERPGLLLLALVLILMGYLFWFAFMTAVAALLDDPYNSNRTQLIMLPLLAAVPAGLALADPVATWIRVVAVLPPTSAAVMPVRILLTDVPAWEIATAVALLTAGILLMRNVAGKVFRLGMLMYGKEPSCAEVRRWLREA